jgi:hypothetical protein
VDFDVTHALGRRRWRIVLSTILLTTGLLLGGCDAGWSDASRTRTPSATPTAEPTAGMVVLGRSFPSEATTGVPDGTSLSEYTGPCTIQSDGTVIDAMIVNCELRIFAHDVVIKNSLINGSV